MLLSRLVLALLLTAAPLAAPAVAQGLGALESSPDHLRLYTECMKLARSEPLKALPAAEKWHAEGGGLAARHCVAVAMFEAGRYGQAAAQFEAIARDMGQDRPGLRAELWAQAGQALMEAGAADKAAEAQSRALDLKAGDPDLWVDRGLSYAAMRAWPRAISDFDRALGLRPNDVEILVLRAAAWRNAGNPPRALDDAIARPQDRAGALRGAARARFRQPGARRAQQGERRLQQGAAPRPAGFERGPARRGRLARRAAGGARTQSAAGAGFDAQARR